MNNSYCKPRLVLTTEPQSTEFTEGGTIHDRCSHNFPPLTPLSSLWLNKFELYLLTSDDIKYLNFEKKIINEKAIPYSDASRSCL